MSRSERDQASVAAERPAHLLVLLIGLALAACASAQVWCSLYRFLDNDELQHLNSAYFISRGAQLYNTFFESHFPLTYWLLQPVVRLARDAETMIVGARLLMFTLSLVTVAACAMLARRASGPAAAWLAPFFLLSQVTFFQKSLEVRPDVGATLCSCLMLLALTSAVRTRRRVWLVAGGAALAGALWFTPKAVYAGAGAVLAACVAFPAAWARWHPRRIAILAWIFAGGALVSAVVLLVLAWLDILRPFLQVCLPANFEMRVDNPAAARAFDLSRSFVENPVTWLLGAAGLVFALTRGRRLWSNPAMPIVAFSLVSGLAGLFANKVPLRQAHLTFSPQLAVMASVVAADLLAAARRRWSAGVAALGLVALLGLVLAPPARAVWRGYASQELQLTVLHRLLAATSSNQRVFDCWTGLYLGRMPAYYYYHLNSDVQRLIAPARLEASLLSILQDPEVTAVIRDRYFDKLPASVRAYILAQFEPLPGCSVVLIRGG